MKHVIYRTFRSGVLFRLFRLVAALGMAAALALPSANATHAEPAAPDAGVVGNGTPASCTEAALTTALAGGGTVTFNCGGPATILVLKQQTIAQPTTIDGGGVITLTGGLASKLFQSMPGVRLDMRNITLDSAFSIDENGAAIRALGPLVLTNVTVQNSIAGAVIPQVQARYCGGAVFVAAEATIRDSTFHKNTALYGGGAICARAAQSAAVIVRNSVFTNNLSILVNGADATGEGLGGAILVDATSKISVVDTAFTGNTARLGGAVYVAPAAALEARGTPTDTLFTSKLRFSNNDAREYGGAIYNAGALSMSYALLTQNRVPTDAPLATYGGAIYSRGALTLTHALLSQNVGDYGGGVYMGPKDGVSPASAMIEHTSFIRNTSDEAGGGLYAESLTTTVTISNSAFHRNTARVFGGGVTSVEAKLRIYNSSFTRNQANAGGGLHGYTSQPAEDYIPVHSSTFSGNTAGSNVGGGIVANGVGIELYNTTIISNTNGLFASNTSNINSNIRFRNTVLDNPGSLNCAVNGAATILDDGNNFSTDASCPLPLPSSQTGPTLNPALGPLTADTLGPTSYHMPLAGSPLIDKGGNCPPRDQIGVARVGACDIGAVEAGGTQPTPTPTPTPDPSPTPSPTPSPIPTPTPSGHKTYLPLVQR